MRIRSVLSIVSVCLTGAALAARAGAQAPAVGEASQSATASKPAQVPPAGKGAGQSAPAPPTQLGDKPAFKPEELDQMLAPIALYPDDLLSQALMASTYPVEIVMADRWVKAHADLKGDALAKALEAEPWEASVKSLVNTPPVLAMFSEKLDWTQKLGDAFLSQQKEVMEAVQRLRGKAQDAGKLESNDQQKVEVKQEGSTEVIVIESSSTEVIYVPTYDPVVVYGSWPYPAYPPYPYYPPGYAGGAFIVGVAWGYAWGNCDWNGGDVDIDIDQNVDINHNIDRDKAREKSGKSWKHDAAHRGNVPYRDQKTAKQHGGRSTGDAAKAREQYRGRDSATTRDQAGAGSRQGAGGAGTKDKITPSGADRSKTRGKSAAGKSGSSGASQRGGALEGVSGGRSAASGQSQRGRSSRSGGGGARGGGGGSRGGGGGRRR